MGLNRHLFIMGAQKSGTTTLFDILKKSNDITIAQKKEGRFLKELHYFDNIEAPNYNEYLRYFNIKTDGYLLDATPIYMFLENIPLKIINTIPENSVKKAIVMLRNPIHRAVSHYKMNIVRENESMPFSEAIREEESRIVESDYNLNYFSYKKRGLYYGQIKRLQKYFGEENVMVIIFEKFIRNPEKTITEIVNYLDIAPFKFQMCHKNNSIVNRNKKLKGFFKKFPINNSIRDRLTKFISLVINRDNKPIYSIEDIELMSRFFKDDINQLEELLGYRIIEWE